MNFSPRALFLLMTEDTAEGRNCASRVHRQQHSVFGSQPRNFGRPERGFDTELLRVLRIQSPPIKLHRLPGNDPPQGLGGQESIEHIQANVPACRAHRYEFAIDAVPQREARSTSLGLELPSHVVATPLIFKQVWGIGARDMSF
jgi:hypothetical protein